MLEKHKAQHIKSIYKKASFFSTELRTRKLTLLMGEEIKETIYKENNCQFWIDPQEAFLNPKLSGERARITTWIKSIPLK